MYVTVTPTTSANTTPRDFKNSSLFEASLIQPKGPDCGFVIQTLKIAANTEAIRNESAGQETRNLFTFNFSTESAASTLLFG